MNKIQTRYDGKCSKCSTEHKAQDWIAYDENAPRGKRALCLNCAGPALYVKAATSMEAEVINRDYAKDLAVAAKPVSVPVASPAVVTKPTTTVNDSLAEVIARAIEPMIKGQLDEARVVELVKEHAKPLAHTITVKSPAIPEGLDMGRQHKQFEQLLLTCNARDRGKRLNVWITGSAGTGKTTAAENVAKALGLTYASTGSLVESYKLFGFIAPGTGKYVATPFREIWECGGVFIFDDFDGSDPVCVIELNNALANGSCTFPDGLVQRHENCILILTANTWGGGATNEYVGRMKQDAAFLDRFVGIEWEIDEELERDTCHRPEWVLYVQKVRANVKAKGLKVLVTPRATYYGAALLDSGLDGATVQAMTLRKAMTVNQWESVR